MTDEIKEILEKIINQSFQAYIVGGYVRDFVLGRQTNDIDICTNALPKDLALIFEDEDIKISNYGSIKLTSKKYTIDINTFRKELKYENGKPTEIEYINDLETDMLRRDFTINALYMDKDGNIIDKVNGLEDLRNKVIKVIGNIEDKFKEDPLRMLRALRLKITHNLKLDPLVASYIQKHKKDLAKITNLRLKEEITKMLLSKNVVEGFEYLRNLDILDILEISYSDLKYIDDINAMYAQLNLNDDFPFTKEEKDNILSIKEIVNYGKIDYKILFKYGLYLSTIAGKILGIENKTVHELYAKMPLKNNQELTLDGDEIQQILNIQPSKIIKDIQKDLIILILNGTLVNDKDCLRNYLIQNKRKWVN